MIELILTKKSKKKARRRRERYESKWNGYKIASGIFIVVSVVLFVVSSFVIDASNYELKDALDILFAVTFIVGCMIRMFMRKAASHWIQDRLKERIWIEDGKLYHFIQIAFASGYNAYNTDRQAYLYEMEISTIINAKYDDKSGRIEFNCNGEGKHYSDHFNNIVDKEWKLNGFEAIFYDSTTPSLYETLKSQGVEFKIGTIDYKFSNKI